MSATPVAAMPSAIDEMLKVSNVAASTDLQSVLDRIASAAVSAVHSAGATSVVLVESADARLRLAAGFGLSDTYREAVGGEPGLLVEGAAANAIASGEMVRVDRLGADPSTSRVRELATSQGFESVLAVPLTTTDSVVGALSVYRTVSGPWESREVALTRFLAERAGSTVRIVHLLAERRERVDGTMRLAAALVAQSREHANRLHAAHGLMHLAEPGEAQAFLAGLLRDHDASANRVARSIRDPVLSGFLLAIMGCAAQQGITVEIDPTSSLDKLPAGVSPAQLITAVASLLDGVLDEVAEGADDERRVRLFVARDGQQLRAEATAAAPGLPVESDPPIAAAKAGADRHDRLRRRDRGLARSVTLPLVGEAQ